MTALNMTSCLGIADGTGTCKINLTLVYVQKAATTFLMATNTTETMIGTSVMEDAIAISSTTRQCHPCSD